MFPQIPAEITFIGYSPRHRATSIFLIPEYTTGSTIRESRCRNITSILLNEDLDSSPLDHDIIILCFSVNSPKHFQHHRFCFRMSFKSIQYKSKIASIFLKPEIRKIRRLRQSGRRVTSKCPISIKCGYVKVLRLNV